MRNIFTEHPNKNGETYLKHFKFALLTSIRLALSSVFFLIHSVFTFFPIPRPFNCRAIVKTLDRCASRAEYRIREE